MHDHPTNRPLRVDIFENDYMKIVENNLKLLTSEEIKCTNLRTT